MQTIVNAVLNEWANMVCQNIMNEWDGMSRLNGQHEVDQVTVVVTNNIVSTITASGMAAWIGEFGSGSLMDTDNPYLEEYEEESYFNKERTSNDYNMLGRAEGEDIIDMDGNISQSSGKAQGLHLEWSNKDNPNWEKYVPIPPMHIIEQQIELALPELKIMLDSAVEEYFLNIDRYV